MNKSLNSHGRKAEENSGRNDNGNNADSDIKYMTTDSGGIITTNNNMNSKLNKRFDKLPDNLRLNGITPSGKPRLFVCNTCTRAFARQEHLTRHERSHTKEKPYVCGICSRAFSRRDLLLRHAHKLHGGNCGDSILKKSKKFNTDRSASNLTTNSPYEKIIKPVTLKSFQRRVSFSAQSAENYAAISNLKKDHQADRVEFSTPPLLPIDLTLIHNINENLRSNSDVNGSNNIYRNEFNLLDKDIWIQQVNTLSSLDESTSDVSDNIRIENNDNLDNFNFKNIKGEQSSYKFLNDSQTIWKNHPKVNSLFELNKGKSGIQSCPKFSLFDKHEAKYHSPPKLTTDCNNYISGDLGFKTENNRPNNNLVKDDFNFSPLSLLSEIDVLKKFTDSAEQNNFNNQQLNSNVGQCVEDEGYTLYGLNYQNMTNITRGLPRNSPSPLNLSSSHFFTEKLHNMCSESLEYYNTYCFGSSNSMSRVLDIPSVQELNSYVALFLDNFSAHYPFIHSGLWQLNLDQFCIYIHENGEGLNHIDEMLYYSNIVCLPLFVATIGSLYQRKVKSKTAELYELSRRVLHVYLDTRRKLKEKSIDLRCNYGNLWLIQSLCLSVIFDIFSETSNMTNSNMLIKQVGAVCSLIRNHLLAIVTQKNAHSLKTISDYILFESKIRTTLTCYNICKFLKVFYHADSDMFLKDQEVANIMIPDDEETWSLIPNPFQISINANAFPSTQMLKKNTLQLGKFYQSFYLSNIGTHKIPESLGFTILFYEYNSLLGSSKSFHGFLTKIGTRKLEANLPQWSNQLIHSSKVLTCDSINLKHSLMCMIFFNKVDPEFGWKVWNNKISELYDCYLSPQSMNILSQESYSLLTDFLVALNFSIKNICNLFLSTGEVVQFDRIQLSMINLQGYYYNFLIIIKFIWDFEDTPNFKLLCIFTELKKLMNNLLLPKLSSTYPLEFKRFVRNDSLSLHSASFPHNSNGHYTITDDRSESTMINIDQLESLINNILVYSFNDISFLKMPSNASNEFIFSPNPEHSIDTGERQSTFISGNTSLLNSMNPPESCEKEFPTKQGFSDRYRLAEKYIVVAKCLFQYIYENHIHCKFLRKLHEDFITLEGKIRSHKSNLEVSNLNISLTSENNIPSLHRPLDSFNPLKGSSANILNDDTEGEQKNMNLNYDKIANDHNSHQLHSISSEDRAFLQLSEASNTSLDHYFNSNFL